MSLRIENAENAVVVAENAAQLIIGLTKLPEIQAGYGAVQAATLMSQAWSLISIAESLEKIVENNRH